MSRATSRPHTTWKDRLAGRAPAHLEQEIDAYESQLALKRQGRVDDKLFAESRLRRGVYGQRYDNGQRHDGERTRTLAFPEPDLLKGLDTRWHAPGMMRIKIPFGRLDAKQLEVLADLAEEYSDGICHVTTRQDVQLHFVHIEDTPDLMRRLAAVGITTREACGNSVRNVTGCPIAGVCPDEAFDVTPHARALAHFLLGHKDVQGFGRKFKISFSGCAGHACALASMHDLGAVAVTRPEGGALRRGFALYVGGGLGAVPHQAQLLDAFVPEDELLPVAQAVCRVFARLGEKQNRNKARLKFLVARLGIEELGRLVREERETLPPDERWTAFEAHLAASDEKPSRPPRPLSGGPRTPALAAWLASNVQDQRQECYTAVTVHLPLGDLTAAQTRRLAAIARRYNGGRVRLTVEQNAVLRWISRGDLPALHAELVAAGLGLPGASSLLDVTACPGTDTCKLGIASSRGLAGELRRRLAERADELDPAVRTLRVKVSGCFNSCGQHHVADVGFYGVSRKKDNRRVPHFQVVLGGQWSENAGAYGLAVAAVPAKRVPEVVDRITGAFAAGRQDGESFQAWVRRRGPAQMRALLEDLTELPAYAAAPELFSDWGDPREYTLGDLGVGECAGEVVSIAEFGLQASERQVFEAQVELDAGRHGAAADKAYRAMLQAAKTLGRTRDLDLADEPDAIVGAFRHGFYDSRLFFDPFAGGKFAHYLFEAHDELAGGNGALDRLGAGDARRRIEEAQLFIEAARACHDRLDEARS